MRANRLRHRVTIVKPVDSQSGSGMVSQTWATLATRFASVEPITGREAIQAGMAIAVATIRVRFRYVPEFTTECRIIHKGRTLEIVKANNIADRNIEHELLCMESVRCLPA